MVPCVYYTAWVYHSGVCMCAGLLLTGGAARVCIVFRPCIWDVVFQTPHSVPLLYDCVIYRLVVLHRFQIFNDFIEAVQFTNPFYHYHLSVLTIFRYCSAKQLATYKCKHTLYTAAAPHFCEGWVCECGLCFHIHSGFIRDRSLY